MTRWWSSRNISIASEAVFLYISRPTVVVCVVTVLVVVCNNQHYMRMSRTEAGLIP